MNPITIIIALAAITVVVYMLIKKADIKLVLFGIGFILLYIALIMGNDIMTGDRLPPALLQPFQIVVNEFKNTLSRAGFIILILGGYTAYMNHIGANAVTVHALTKPLKNIKSVYLMVPFVFLLGNLLSLVIPSASNLAIILLATLFPVLKATGMSTLTAAGIIATTATVMPTPLGGDNVAIATELVKYPEFANLTVTDYVFNHHALVSIPTLLLMAVVHFFWQKYCDKRDLKAGVAVEEEVQIDASQVTEVTGSGLYKLVYALLPLLPIFLLIAIYLLSTLGGPKIDLSVEVAVLICFIVALIAELLFKRKPAEMMKGAASFFKGMAGAFDIVVLLVAATVFVSGLKGIGLISQLQTVMETSTTTGFVLPLILVLLTALIVILSGSGTALFYSMVPLMYPLALAAGISALAITIPMGLAGNLLRAVSPVSAVIIIVAGSTKKNPMEIVRRTSVPMIVGTVFMFVLTMILFL